MTTLPPIAGLGTTWLVEVFDAITEEQTHIIFNDLRLLVTAFNNRYSHFNPDSIISTLNAARKLPKPDKETIALLEYGTQLYHDTNEVFNFLVGENMGQHGYDALYSFTPKDESITTPDPTHALFITKDKIILTVGQVDIGGYARGYLIDLIAERIQKNHGLKYFLVNSAGDMYGTSRFGEPITVELNHPTHTRTCLIATTIFNQGFASSRSEIKSNSNSSTVSTKSKHDPDTSLVVFVKAPLAKQACAWATTLLLSAPQNHESKLLEHSIKVALFDPNTGQLHYYQGF
jgi:thiamine biosynthesis lipoprotein ApbE